ncbi:anoctamin-like protein Os01g0706700 [Oryza brachyantha]|uniref:Anoctamin transmembrane domain-containing protein n=1 Tax=Oryza brachyantha TaxID=4533 RepID=J3L3B9_ORYBR|nr:anoctamin-like protein Os01g0706700 [Oryza brachyantha]
MGEGGPAAGAGAAVEDATGFEVGIVVPKLSRSAAAGCGEVEDCVARLVRELEDVGLLVERVRGVPAEFIKLSAPMGTLGRAASQMQMKKLTYIGMELQFEWDQVAAFVRQPDGSLFSWRERFACFRHLIYGIVNKSNSDILLKFDDKEFHWNQNESLLTRLEDEGVVKLVFPLHDEVKRKKLLRNWALNWLDFTWQPMDEIYSYFGTKIAIYFSFLGMYTRWLFFPAVFGLATQLIDFGSLQWLVLPAFFIFVISWAVFFLQFWKRKNSALIARWGIDYSFSEYKTLANELGPLSCSLADDDVQERKLGDVPDEKRILQRNEWFGVLLRIRNNAIIVLAIICLQLPFELAYAHLYEIIETEVLRYVLTAMYLVAIQYYTRIGGKVSVILIKYENNQGEQSSADSLVYKVFGLYFMQSYIGLFYHASLYRDIMTLRQVLIKRLIVSQVLENLIENSIPYLKYSYKKYRAVHKKKHEKESPAGKSVRLSTRVEKEYLKPSYTASIGEELEDGLFDDFLELTLQFGMIMMFACAFPLIFCFAALNNVTEIRADALKLLVMLKRPAPRAAATIGAWLNIFQFLVVMAICTNCLLLVCLYDVEGKWRIEPGLAAILIIEHALLLIKFGFSHFVPEEPAWVKANRVRYVAQAQNVCSKQLLRSISKLDTKWE